MKEEYIIYWMLLLILGITIYFSLKLYYDSKSRTKSYNPVIDPYWAHGGRHYSGLLY